MLTPAVPEFTCPINSWMIFGGSPAAGMTVGFEIIRAIPKSYMQRQRSAMTLWPFGAKVTSPPSGCDKLFSTSTEKIIV
jgi:hypothetical protein